MAKRTPSYTDERLARRQCLQESQAEKDAKYGSRWRDIRLQHARTRRRIIDERDARTQEAEKLMRRQIEEVKAEHAKSLAKIATDSAKRLDEAHHIRFRAKRRVFDCAQKARDKLKLSYRKDMTLLRSRHNIKEDTDDVRYLLSYTQVSI